MAFLLLSAYLWPNQLNAAREQKIPQKFLRGRIVSERELVVVYMKAKRSSAIMAFLILTLLPLSLSLANFML